VTEAELKELTNKELKSFIKDISLANIINTKRMVNIIRSILLSTKSKEDLVQSIQQIKDRIQRLETSLLSGGSKISPRVHPNMSPRKTFTYENSESLNISPRGLPSVPPRKTFTYVTNNESTETNKSPRAPPLSQRKTFTMENSEPLNGELPPIPVRPNNDNHNESEILQNPLPQISISDVDVTPTPPPRKNTMKQVEEPPTPPPRKNTKVGEAPPPVPPRKSFNVNQ